MNTKQTYRIVAVVIALIAIFLIVRSRFWESGSPSAPILSVQEFNQTQNSSSSVAFGNDQIALTLTAQNSGSVKISNYVFQVDLSHVANVASLLNLGGSTYDAGTQALAWPATDIPAHQSVQKKFTVQVNPVTSTAESPVLDIQFNNDLKISLLPGTASGVAIANPSAGAIPYTAPGTGTSLNLILALAVCSVSAVFIFRNRKSVVS